MVNTIEESDVFSPKRHHWRMNGADIDSDTAERMLDLGFAVKVDDEMPQGVALLNAYPYAAIANVATGLVRVVDAEDLKGMGFPK